LRSLLPHVQEKSLMMYSTMHSAFESVDSIVRLVDPATRVQKPLGTTATCFRVVVGEHIGKWAAVRAVSGDRLYRSSITIPFNFGLHLGASPEETIDVSCGEIVVRCSSNGMSFNFHSSDGFRDALLRAGVPDNRSVEKFHVRIIAIDIRSIVIEVLPTLTDSLTPLAYLAAILGTEVENTSEFLGVALDLESNATGDEILVRLSERRDQPVLGDLADKFLQVFPEYSL
jgi:hypothetical protein